MLHRTPYEQILTQKGQQSSLAITYNAKSQNPNVKSMSNIKCPNESEVRTAVRCSLARSCPRQVSRICFVIETFAFNLAFVISGVSGLGCSNSTRLRQRRGTGIFLQARYCFFAGSMDPLGAGACRRNCKHVTIHSRWPGD